MIENTDNSFYTFFCVCLSNTFRNFQEHCIILQTSLHFCLSMFNGNLSFLDFNVNVAIWYFQCILVTGSKYFSCHNLIAIRCMFYYMKIIFMKFENNVIIWYFQIILWCCLQEVFSSHILGMLNFFGQGAVADISFKLCC